MGRRLNIVEAVCLIAGAGIGGGVMALPYLAAETGFWPALIMMIIGYLVSVVLHVMVAELSIRAENSSELLTIFTRFLFRGRRALRGLFYALMAVTLVCNLAAYISGAGDILASLLGIRAIIGQALFFVCAAALVLMGLKRIAGGEVVTLAVMLGILAFLVVCTFATPGPPPVSPGDLAPAFADVPAKLGPANLPLDGQYFTRANWGAAPLLVVFGMAMFSLSSLFAVPQAASGLGGGKGRLRAAVAVGLFINLITMVTITLSALIRSEAVTEVAITGWTAGLGRAMMGFASLFIALAMLGTFWSISLQLSDMTKEYFRSGRVPAWLAATAPSFALAILPSSGFLELMQIAGGATAVIVAFMTVPAYRCAIRGEEGLLLGRLGKSRILSGVIVIMYLLMATGSFL